MKRIAAIGFVAFGAAVSAATGVAAQPQAPRAALSGFICQKALDPEERAVQVTATMRPVPRTKHMAVRFDLLSRPGQASSYSVVSYGDLGSWVTPPDPTLGQRAGDRWIVKKPVIDLAAPASYRFEVEFRWTGARGRVLASRVLRSPSCFEPELRPNLVIRSLTVVDPPNKPSLDHYRVVIANTGATPTGAFQVQFSDSTDPAVTQTVASIAPHHRTAVVFGGAECSPQSDTVIADPSQQVDVSSRAGATMTAVCPTP